MTTQGTRPAARGIGLGLAALGRPGYLTLGHGGDIRDGASVDDLRARTHAVLDAAWAAGVRYVDAARSYGLAERFLGEWLAAHPGRRDELTVGSKWGYTYTAGWRVDADVHEVKDHSLETFRRQWQETLAALGGPPDVYLVHSLTSDSPALGDDRLLAALAELAHDGVATGFSASGPDQGAVIERALDLTADGGRRSARSRPRGTCWSRRPGRRWPGSTTPAGTSSSRRRWRTGGSPIAATSRAFAPRRTRLGRAPTRWHWPPCSRSRSPTSR